MNRLLRYVSFGALLCGIALAATFAGIIVIRLPWRVARIELSEQIIAHKKKIQLWFWRNDRWRQESTELVLSSDPAIAIMRIVNSWCTTLEEEGLTKKKIGVEAVLMASGDHDAYISFDRSLFDKESTTFEKWMRIESLLKTLRANGIHAKMIYLQTHHQPLHDYHLDCTNPWPIEGYQNNAF